MAQFNGFCVPKEDQVGYDIPKRRVTSVVGLVVVGDGGKQAMGNIMAEIH